MRPQSADSFQIFDLEQYQSFYEHLVEINLADSSPLCVGMDELLTLRDESGLDGRQREHRREEERRRHVARLLSTGFYYPQVNGTAELRTLIASLYTGVTPENVLVTVGASQANSITCSTLLTTGQEVVVISPTYRQVWGLAKSMGCDVKELQLREEDYWRPDLDALDGLITHKTKLVGVVNPNNPTGMIFSDREMRRIVDACARVGAWLHADEVYMGTERQGVTPTKSFWGMYDRLICTNSLSKAYGLAGLRIGWALADKSTIQELWRRHEYAVIAASAPSMALAAIALDPTKRKLLLDRQRQFSNSGWKVLEPWLKAQNGVFSVCPAEATGVAFVRFNLPVGSVEFAEHLRKTQDLLVAPGSFLGAENYLRLTIGYSDAIGKALDRLAAGAASILTAMR